LADFAGGADFARFADWDVVGDDKAVGRLGALGGFFCILRVETPI
jgi:hypothetical protein